MYQSETIFPSGLTWRAWLGAGITLAKGQVQQVFATLKMWRNRSGQRRALRDLPNYRLKDIGISRMDAVREAEKPFWRR
ncbi:MAG: DUF1127 domain-containing protein [Rhodospirillales bacterium]|nr:DUF1127 domain-containing protein [Rhodospirillales bacterium]